MAELLRGAPVATAITEDLIVRSDALKAQGVVPKLAIIRVGERGDDLSYERGAEKRCAAAGVAVRKVVLPADCSQAWLMDAISEINADTSTHGCLMFRPLPAGLDEASACSALGAAKDVDCITERSLFGVFAGQDLGFPPCTAEAVLAVLDYYGVKLTGALVTVVGRSLVVGKPVSMMLQARNATVTMCHTRTRDLAAECRRADIVVVAAGHPKTIGADCMRAGQVIVDVGINWDDAAGRLVGDVDASAAEGFDLRFTPVPGGLGSITTAILVKHVIEAAERAANVRGR